MSEVSILENHFDPEVVRSNMTSRYWFMQNMVRTHKTAEISMWFEMTFDERLIELDAKKCTTHGIQWPPYNLDVNLCEFFLWGYIKDRICRSFPDSLENLKLAIRSKIGALDSNKLQRNLTEFQDGYYSIIIGDCRHFENLKC